MSLGWKFFISHVFVVAVGLLVMALSTAFVAPETFSSHMQNMPGMEDNSMMGGPNRRGSMLTSLDEELDLSFRESVNSALLRAGIAATLAAGIVSWLVSLRIVKPIRQVANASQYIAEGHYEHRLLAPGGDELGNLVESFNHMATALAETEMMRQRLIGDVSHELKTPLSSIKGYMEGLEDGVIPPTPETFQLVHREADRLQRLVHDLQELSRAEAGAVQLDRKSHDLVDITQTVVARLLPQFSDQNIALNTNYPEHSVTVQVDRDRIEQVITNLLGNVLQYTPRHGKVTVTLSASDNVAQLSVKDTGVGLTQADLVRIFQRFYRVDKSRSRLSGGSGVGLTIARHIIEAHGGRIWADSPGLDQGSTFTFELPYCSKNKQQEESV